MENKISLNNIIMNVVHTDGIGVVNKDTYFILNRKKILSQQTTPAEE